MNTTNLTPAYKRLSVTPVYERLIECQPPEEGVTDRTRRYYPYIPDGKLVKAVNLAIQLNRPLLLEGEPGCGKTRLADALAYQFSRKYLEGQADAVNPESWYKYYIWNVKSNSQARDGLYRFDAVARLRDAQLVGSDPEKLKEFMGEDLDDIQKNLKDKTRYIKFGKLGESLEQLQEPYPIVLIDEIDKADSDFCNDLLFELERQSFEIPETGQTYPKPETTVKPRPIVIITSNQERQLPEPFLRRCLYYYLDFPDTAVLSNIIQSRFGTKAKEQQQYVVETIEHFQEIRGLLKDKPGSKLPGTSELIDFLQVFFDTQEKADLEKLAEEPHLLGIILKTKADRDLYQKQYGDPGF